MNQTEAQKREIARIKKKYDFSEQYDLFAALSHLPTEIVLRPSLPRPSDMKKQIEVLIDSINILVGALRNTSLQTKNVINQTPEDLIQIGIKNIKNNNTNWQLSSFENDLGILRVSCLFSLQKIPIDRTGRNKNSIPGFVIFKLIPIYHNGTGKRPTVAS
jgi:hypothetical protein